MKRKLSDLINNFKEKVINTENADISQIRKNSFYSKTFFNWKIELGNEFVDFIKQN